MSCVCFNIMFTPSTRCARSVCVHAVEKDSDSHARSLLRAGNSDHGSDKHSSVESQLGSMRAMSYAKLSHAPRFFTATA